MGNLVERFLRYTKFDTKSDSSSSSCPSTPGQLLLARHLADELEQIGMQDVEMDENGYVMATLPGNCPAPVIGFIAHVDTAPDYSGENVQARVVMGYDGQDIVLNAEQNVVLSPRDFPELSRYTGQDIIVTDGTTLLGADNKAGVAEIITAMEYLIASPIRHGTVRVAFTVDEEIGRGANKFDVARFGCEFAYTVDGGEVGELEFENFNAAEARLTINGRNVHPGSAKNKMINSQLIAFE
ncbi:MAG: peptidase T, partial [Negativicutes bacterium]|nr:peptidase T [Negativicutes bacterium]